MAKKPLPSTMEPINVGKQPPFTPLPLGDIVGPPPPKGVYQEAGLYLKLYDYVYNGQAQTATINIRTPKPV
jgi:hypothetical protein